MTGWGDQPVSCQNCDTDLTRRELLTHECAGLRASRERGRKTMLDMAAWAECEQQAVSS